MIGEGWIRLVEVEQKSKTKLYHVYFGASDEYLGYISLLPRWRRYVFRPNPNTILIDEHLIELTRELKCLDKQYKNDKEVAE